jgi:hypothetical protein
MGLRSWPRKTQAQHLFLRQEKQVIFTLEEGQRTSYTHGSKL